MSTFDLFRNYEKISSVTCRSLLMHGRDDQMVPFAHSHDVLYPLLVDPHAPVWLEGCGHHDMPDDACLRAVSDFESELQMAQMNAALSGGQTLFLPSASRSSFLASRLIREVVRLGGDVGPMVPLPVQRRLEMGCSRD